MVLSEASNNTLLAELAREEFTVLRTWGGGLQVCSDSDIEISIENFN